jgi:PHD/YefM family antitoxin component YafN of YafNO toxin-antitoxin module
MENYNITNYRKNIYKLMEDTVEYNTTVTVSTKKGNAVVMSEEDYNGLMETLYISSFPATRDEILESIKAPIEDFIPEEEVKW